MLSQQLAHGWPERIDNFEIIKLGGRLKPKGLHSVWHIRSESQDNAWTPVKDLKGDPAFGARRYGSGFSLSESDFTTARYFLKASEYLTDKDTPGHSRPLCYYLIEKRPSVSAVQPSRQAVTQRRSADHARSTASQTSHQQSGRRQNRK